MICNKCNTEKGVEFYNNDRTCKDCRKELVKLRTIEKRKDPKWIEKERARGREKYSRLGYKDKQREWDKDKPWKQTSAYKNLHRDLKIPKGIAAHHWNYEDDNLRDIVLMNNKDHKAFHQFIELDTEKKIFKIKGENGWYLDTRQSHLNHIKICGFKYLEYSKDIDYNLTLTKNK